MDRTRPVSAIFVALVSLGCQGNSGLVPVAGKVLLDGQPLTQGTVVTMPKAGKGANAAVHPDGTFQLGTNGKGDGASIGTHKVAVILLSDSSESAEGPAPKSLLPQRYGSPESSGLTIDVKGGGESNVILKLSSK
jgi:hypothetical protein